LHVVYFDEWQVAGQGEGFGEAYPDHEGADQARATGEGYGVDIVRSFIRPAEGDGYGGHDVALVGAAGVFGHYATEFFVDGLAGGYVAKDFPVGDYGGRGVVAARFYG
jgi:hypothetical protein